MEQALSLDVTSPSWTTVMAQLVLHSDVAASDTSNTKQPTLGVFTCIRAQAHVMGAAVTGALDSSPHNRGAGETSHPREMENCPIQESAVTPHCRQNKTKLAFKATYLSAPTYLSSLILNYTIPSRSISHTNIFPKLSRLSVCSLCLERPFICREAGLHV